MTPPDSLCDPAMEVVRVHGSDAGRFLHAQFTSDVAAMPPGSVGLSAWCSPRGRVRNLFWIVRRPLDAGFDLIAPLGEADDLVRRLRTFVLRSKVTVERSGDRVFGAAGADAELRAAGWTAAVPAAARAAAAGVWYAVRPPGGPVRLLLLGPDHGRPRSGGPDAKWRRLEIAAGIAWLDEVSRESFVPQMLNLDRLGALSFDKGCYPGQEIVARAHHLGRIKRRLYRGWLAAGRPPAPGDRIRSGGGSAGAVVVSERDERGEGYDLLAVLETDRASGRLEAEDGRILAVSPATAPAG